MPKHLNVLDLFAGIGGLSLGFEMVGARPIAAVEVNPRHATFYAANRAFAVKTFCESIEDIEALDLAREVGFRPRELDLIIGGPPCQPFSSAGKRKGTDDVRGTLIGEFVRYVAELQPRAFVMENVVGLKSIHGGIYLKSIIKRFGMAGYRSSVFVLDAADYGVPQRRRRLFVVGSRLDWIDLTRPLPTHGASEGLLIGSPYRTVRDAISDLPKADRLAEAIEDSVRLPYDSLPNEYQRLLRGRLRRVTGNGITIHWPHILEAIDLKALPPGSVEKSTRYRRLHWDAPSITLRAGSGSFTALRPIHPTEARVITVREAARIQSFPDAFQFAPQRKAAHQQIGNSVPPLLAKAVAEKIVDGLMHGRARA